MKRKMILTVTGNDESQEVNCIVDFVPAAGTKGENPNSGFSKLIGVLLRSLSAAAADPEVQSTEHGEEYE